jgi:sulfotransferase
MLNKQIIYVTGLPRAGSTLLCQLLSHHLELASLEFLQDLDNQLQQNLFYIVFEHLMAEPDTILAEIFLWLGSSPISMDWQNLQVRPHESDSYYRYKYRHQTHSTLKPPKRHVIPSRIQNQLEQQFSWFYSTFYPGILQKGLT